MDTMHLDLYCERCGPGLWAEPLNAITNASFLIAAWASWTLANRLRCLTPSLWVLIALAVSIGIGSALFHTFATTWSMILDVVPIFLFQLWFLWLYCRQVIGLGIRSSLGILGGLLATSVGGMQLTEILNGSLMYAPALMILFVIGYRHFRCARGERWSMLVASGILLVSLLFRTIDLAVCPCFMSGTHFLWHLLNGVVIYLALRCLIIHRLSQIAVRIS